MEINKQKLIDNLNITLKNDLASCAHLWVS